MPNKPNSPKRFAAGWCSVTELVCAVQFVSALAALAQRANFNLAEVAHQVLQCEGPVTRATETLPVRFYDDKVRHVRCRCMLLSKSVASDSDSLLGGVGNDIG